MSCPGISSRTSAQKNRSEAAERRATAAKSHQEEKRKTHPVSNRAQNGDGFQSRAAEKSITPRPAGLRVPVGPFPSGPHDQGQRYSCWKEREQQFSGMIGNHYFT